MQDLNKVASCETETQAVIQFAAANMIASLTRLEENVWELNVKDTFTSTVKITRVTAIQASAIIALFVGELEDSELNTKLFAIAEPALIDFPHECRPIP